MILYHFMVMIFFGVMTYFSYHNHFGENYQITFVIMTFIAYMRVVNEQSRQQQPKRELERALVMERIHKSHCDVVVGRCVFEFDKHIEALPGFREYMVRFRSGEEVRLLTSRKEIIHKIRTTNKELLYYINMNYIVDVEEIKDEMGANES